MKEHPPPQNPMTKPKNFKKNFNQKSIAGSEKKF